MTRPLLLRAGGAGAATTAGAADTGDGEEDGEDLAAEALMTFFFGTPATTGVDG